MAFRDEEITHDFCKDEPELTEKVLEIERRPKVILRELRHVARTSKCSSRQCECHWSADYVEKALAPIRSVPQKKPKKDAGEP